jgi:hypothetical protein
MVDPVWGTGIFWTPETAMIARKMAGSWGM